ncbi:MAG TPA: DRTGG domain-containing protein [Dehalococcoidia bacterium]
MNVVLVTSREPGAGKTALASALALRLAYEGRKVLALRLGGGDGDGSAEHDAAFYAEQPYARGRGGRPLPSVEEARRAAGDAAVLFLEAPAGADPAALLPAEGAVVLCVRWSPEFSAEAVKAQAGVPAESLLGVAVIAVPAKLLGEVRARLIHAGLPVLAALPEDRTLYAPRLSEVVEALDAEVLLGEVDGDPVIENVQINPISADPGYRYFRQKGAKAVITRSDKTDLQLAALKTDTDCLILTGGLPPSPYTLDHAASNETVLLLTQGDTNATVRHLEDIYGRTRFGSERKLERMAELLGEHADLAVLARLAG